MKKIMKILSILILLSSCNLLPTDKNKKELANDISFINNEKIKYSIVLKSCDTCVPISNIGYRVLVELNEKEDLIVKKLKKESWVSLLNDDKSDWAANLLLYYLHDKNAIIFRRKEAVEMWHSYFKKEDLDYWHKTLK
jgi:hypothetical protein